MIKATFTNNPRFTQVRLTSDQHDKVVIVTKYTNTWQGKHESNGAIFNCDNYNQSLQHLKKKGW